MSSAGFEPTAPRLGIWCSILLSYEDAPPRIAQAARAMRGGRESRATPARSSPPPPVPSRATEGETHSSIRDIDIAGLTNAHAVEARAIQPINRQVERIETCPEMQERLAQILEGLGTSPSSFKDIGTSLMGKVAAIARYRSLVTMAEAAGDTGAPCLLEQSLQEETAMARWVGEHLDATTRRTMQRESVGQTAGV